MRTELEVKAAIELYKKEYTESVRPPDCEKCYHNQAEVYDQLAGENYCLTCLEKSLREDVDDLFTHISIQAVTEHFHGDRTVEQE